MKPTLYLSLSALPYRGLAIPSPHDQSLTRPYASQPNTTFSGVVPGFTDFCDPTSGVTVCTDGASNFVDKRTDVPGDREHAPYVAHAKLPGCPNCLSTGFCGHISIMQDFHDSTSPPWNDCEGIRRWLVDHNNQGYWHVDLKRLHTIPWVPLITAGSCTVVVSDDGTDNPERDAVIVGTKDVARVVESAIWDHNQDGTVGIKGSWDYCPATTYRADNLARWNMKFQLMIKSQVP